jgi:hypothetical protein
MRRPPVFNELRILATAQVAFELLLEAPGQGQNGVLGFQWKRSVP